MKKILVPTDFSENAYNALLYATRLYRKENVKFYLMNSFEEEITLRVSRIDRGRAELVIEELYSRSKSKLEKVKNKISVETEGSAHSFVVIPASKELAREINYLINKKNIDMVFMGTKGAGGVKGVLLGSQTSRIIKRINGCPLFIIPEACTYGAPAQIAFATDLKHDYNEGELTPITEMAKLGDSVVHIVHVMEQDSISKSQRTNFDRLLEKLNGLQKEVHWLPMDRNKTETIVKFVEDDSIDLLVMIYHKHPFIKKLFHRSLAKRIGRIPKTPYMVIPSGKMK